MKVKACWRQCGAVGNFTLVLAAERGDWRRRVYLSRKIDALGFKAAGEPCKYVIRRCHVRLHVRPLKQHECVLRGDHSCCVHSDTSVPVRVQSGVPLPLEILRVLHRRLGQLVHSDTRVQPEAGRREEFAVRLLSNRSPRYSR